MRFVAAPASARRTHIVHWGMWPCRGGILSSATYTGQAPTVGTVEVPDADAAIEAAVTKFGVTTKRLIAVRQSLTAATIYLNAEGTTRPNNVV